MTSSHQHGGFQRLGEVLRRVLADIPLQGNCAGSTPHIGAGDDETARPRTQDGLHGRTIGTRDGSGDKGGARPKGADRAPGDSGVQMPTRRCDAGKERRLFPHPEPATGDDATWESPRSSDRRGVGSQDRSLERAGLGEECQPGGADSDRAMSAPEGIEVRRRGGSRCRHGGPVVPHVGPARRHAVTAAKACSRPMPASRSLR